MAKRPRCECGRAMSKVSVRCTRCHTEHMDELEAEASAIVATGACPDCGSKLKRNLALTGWWMCEQRGAEGFRARPNDPPCDFQTFTTH